MDSFLLLLGEARLEVEHILSTKINYAHDHSPDVTRVLDLCHAHPALALEAFTEDQLAPLEIFLKKRSSMTVIQEFCARHPKAIRQESRSCITEGLPLHVSCDLVIQLAYTSELIPYLVDLYPQAVSMRDKEGHLPLHKLLRKYAVRVRPAVLQDRIEDVTKELQALLQIYPESILEKGSCILDMTPLQFVLSVYSNILHPRLLHAMLGAAQTAVTHLQFEGSLGGPGVWTQECAEAMQVIMPRLQTIEWSLEKSAQYTPAGFASFFQSFQLCCSLRKLDIYLPTRIIADDNEHGAYAAVMDTIPTLTSLKVLNLSLTVSIVSDKRRHRIANLAQPIAKLIRHGVLQQLSVCGTLSDVWVDPVPILAASIHAPNLQALELRPCPPHLDLTALLVDLLRSKDSALQKLALKNIQFQTKPVLEALARNATLQCMRLPNIIIQQHDEDQQEIHNIHKDIPHDNPHDENRGLSLSQVLQQANTTLRSVYCANATLQERQSLENQQIQYYTLLNRFGRGQLRCIMTCTTSVMVDLLTQVQSNLALMGNISSRNGVLNVTYGILREVPMLWSSSSR